MTTMNMTAKSTEPVDRSILELHRGCFACGADNPRGLNLRYAPGDDGVSTAVWHPSPEFCSYPGRLHGGVIATLLDSAMVHALFGMGIAGMTAELSIRYRICISVDNLLQVDGWVESERHGIYFCKARIRQSGIPCVQAMAKFMTTPEYPPRSPRHTTPSSPNPAHVFPLPEKRNNPQAPSHGTSQPIP